MVRTHASRSLGHPHRRWPWSQAILRKFQVLVERVAGSSTSMPSLDDPAVSLRAGVRGMEGCHAEAKCKVWHPRLKAANISR
jgi:hypothetical protein